jgi:hypothetical protein
LNSSIDPQPHPTPTTESLPAASLQAFTGDLGHLPVDARRVLVQLLLGPAIDGRRHPRLWPVLLRDEAVVRSRLHELFLELVVDRDQQVAFTRQVATEELDVPVLLRRATLSFLDSALLLYLRQRLTQADAQGERAVVALQEITDHLSVFERTGNMDHAKFERHVENAAEKAKKLSLLRRIPGGDDRFEVSPTLKLLFPAEEIQTLTRTYAALAQVAAGDVTTEDSATGELEDEPEIQPEEDA